MVHRQEYRLYWVIWGAIPILIVMLLQYTKVLRQQPVVAIVVTDSIPDYLKMVGEPISIGFRVEGIDSSHLKATWWFGDSVLLLQSAPPDSGEVILKSRVEWKSVDTSATGLGIEIHFDTLPARNRILWRKARESHDRQVTVRFRAKGRYGIKLMLVDTLRGDTLVKEQFVDIVAAMPKYPGDTMVKIIGPSTGYVGEELVFSATGTHLQYWNWEFGDVGSQTSNQPQVVHSYESEGKYVVRFSTTNPDRVLEHTVEIFPTWNADSIAADTMGPPEDLTERYAREIKNWLQEIANTSTAATDRFYQLKDIIKQGYLSNRMRTVYVWVNEDDPVDFDSYCQQIHWLRGELVIEKVDFDWVGDSTLRRVGALRIQQHNVIE